MSVPKNKHISSFKIGAGGRKLWDVPGVTFPPHVLKLTPGYNPKTCEPYSAPPAWGIRTEEAGVILGSSASAARIMLRRKKVKFAIVSRPNLPPCVYWQRDKVEELAGQKPRVISEGELAGFLSTQEAAEFACVGRSTIQRAVKSGKLKPVYVRVLSAQGKRRRCVFDKRDLAKYVQRARVKWREKSEALEAQVRKFEEEGEA